jgi:hypothetical protein
LKYISIKGGVRGMLPLGCFLLGGREGVILQAAAENKRIETKEDFNSEPKNHGLSLKKTLVVFIRRDALQSV